MALSAQDRAAQVAIFGEDWVKQLEQIQAGDFKGAGALKPGNAFASLGDNALVGGAGVGSPMAKGLEGIQTTGNEAGYKAGVAQELDPIAAQYQQVADNSAVTSNVDPAFRQYQLGLAQQLQQQANGTGPSIAQAQLQQATDRTLNQSLGAIRSATGANAGLAARSAALAGAQGLGSAGNQSALLRLQEQQQAQQQLAGLANTGRAQDLDVDSNSLQAQQATMNGKLGALGGLSQIGIAKTNPYANIYGAQVDTISQDKNIAANQVAQAAAAAESRAIARRNATAAQNAQITGAILSTAGAAAGSFLGPAGTVAGAKLGATAGQAGYDALSGEQQEANDRALANRNAGN